MGTNLPGTDRPLDFSQLFDDPLAETASGSTSGSESQPGTGRRPRFGMPKVRMGCTVCKIRKVKCDETKPSCIRCTSTGRTCEGYLPVLQRNRKPRGENSVIGKAHTAAPGDATSGFNVFQLPSASPSPTPTIDGIEHKSLHFFWAATEHDVSRHFEPHFWGRLVLQASREHPTVQYALDAVSALYHAYAMMEHATHRSQGVLDTPTTRSALVCYNKAVKLISDDLSAGTIPPEAVLICCLLFVWLEFLRNDFATGMKHLRSGLAILQETSSTPTATSTSPAIDESIPHIFTRLQLQATLHGCPSSDFNSSPMKCPSEAVINPDPPAFFTLAEGRHSLDAQMVYIFQLVREKQTFEASRGFQAAIGCPEWSQLIAKRDAHIHKLMRWSAAFQNSSLFATGHAADSIGVLLLRVSFAVASMVLRALFFDSEMQYDAYNAEFAQMLTLVNKILQFGGPKGQHLVLSLDTGVIPALCYIILKCRERDIRYKAMEALKSAPEREGIWHRDSAIAATTWKVTVEERLAAELGALGKDQGPLPESARIFREKVQDAGEAGKSAVVRFDGGPAGSSITEWELNGLLSRMGDVL